jgi:hypothetical protein
MCSERLALWLDVRCRQDHRLAGGLNTLLKDFNRWSKSVVLAREPFVELLQRRGFRTVLVESTWLVIGMCLKEDAEIYLGVSSPHKRGARTAVIFGWSPTGPKVTAV